LEPDSEDTTPKSGTTDPKNGTSEDEPPAKAAASPRHGALLVTLQTGARKYRWAIGGALLLLALIEGGPAFIRSWRTVSTGDAYVHGHVTFVAPRVAGQVVRVFVDDNNRVHKGDRLVELDKKPYEVRVGIARAALGTAQANIVVAKARARAAEGQARSLRFKLQRAIEDVDNQISLLRSKVAALRSVEASLAKAQADYERGKHLIKSQAISKEELDLRAEAFLVAQAKLEEARQSVYQVRVGLGLPAKLESGGDLSQVPPDLDQTFSSVRQAQASLIHAVAELGVTGSFNRTPRQMIEDFYARDPQGNIDRIFEQLVKGAPLVKEAEAKLVQAERNVDQAELNLSYCDVVSEIDGVVTRREVNPGNNVIPGQGLMAIRSLTDIWIDANFKETQLAKLRIGQPVDVEVDMYGSRQLFKGRVSGFTMGTGSTLALLPAENATGNFVKVVQRLPVRIDLQDYDPDKTPLFFGLSVTPYVYVHRKPTGPGAGRVLQPYLVAATAPPSKNAP
jgi:membrane fusion protein, multidrug efflux system